MYKVSSNYYNLSVHIVADCIYVHVLLHMYELNHEVETQVDELYFL